MSIFNSNNSDKWSKSELLELMIAQKKEIERLECEVQSLKAEVSAKDKEISERSTLIQVTNALIQITKRIDARLTESEEKNHE